MPTVGKKKYPYTTAGKALTGNAVAYGTAVASCDSLSCCLTD